MKFVAYFQLSEESIEKFLNFLNRIYDGRPNQNTDIKGILVDYNACFEATRDVDKKLLLVRVIYPTFREIIQNNTDIVFSNIGVFLEILSFYQNLLN